MPAVLDLSGLHQGHSGGYLTTTGIDPTAETTIFSSAVPPGQLDTIGAVLKLNNWGIVTSVGNLAFNITFKLKYGSSVVATVAALGLSNSGTFLVRCKANVATLSDTTVEAHMIVLGQKKDERTLQFANFSTNTSAQTVGSIAGSVTVSLTAQWNADPASVVGVYTSRLTTFSFASS